MSSDEERQEAKQSRLKNAPRTSRACDGCRRKKIRCDGPQMPDKQCSNCIGYNIPCKYEESAKRGPPKGYVEGLESRLEKAEKLIRQLLPVSDLQSQDLDDFLDSKSPSTCMTGSMEPSTMVSPSLRPREPKPPAGPKEVAFNILSKIGEVNNEPDVPDDDQYIVGPGSITDNLTRLTIDPVSYRFFGKSSGALLIQTAINMKSDFTKVDPTCNFLPSRRPEYWSVRPWETEAINPLNPDPPNYEYPDPDLLVTLTDLFFKNVNKYYPLLHRPTFERLIDENFHLTNEAFAATVILVCACGSRFSNDRRVYLDGNNDNHCRGWRYFSQFQLVKRSLLRPPTLFDVQMIVLCVMFLQSSSAPQATWVIIGIGIRLAQDVGAHRKPGPDQRAVRTKTEDELWKRAFWVLVTLDRNVSSILGRPSATQDEDFDLDFPLECDDEWWDHPDPDKSWRQPSGRPSTVSAFNCVLRLNKVMAVCLRTIYGIAKPKIAMGFVGEEWDQLIVAELDSALNKWVDSIPHHLRWDPNRGPDILVHRPFISPGGNAKPLAYSALAICSNASRMCSQIVARQQELSEMPCFLLQMPAFVSAIMLLLNIWGGLRSGLHPDPRPEMMNVKKCMNFLKSMEYTWHSAGKLWDILYELATVGDLPISTPSPDNHDTDGTPSRSPPQDTSSRLSNRSGSQQPCNMSDLHYSSLTNPAKQQTGSQAEQSDSQSFPPDSSNVLPMYTKDLGHLPPPQVNGKVPVDINQWFTLGQSGLSNNPTSIVSDLAFDLNSLSSASFDPSFSNTIMDQSTQYHTPNGQASVDTGQSGASTSSAFYPQLVDDEVMDLWSHGPSNFNLEEWGPFLTSFSDVHHSHLHNGQDRSRPS